jgi:hypothetical protein
LIFGQAFAFRPTGKGQFQETVPNNPPCPVARIPAKGLQLEQKVNELMEIF